MARTDLVGELCPTGCLNELGARVRDYAPCDRFRSSSRKQGLRLIEPRLEFMGVSLDSAFAASTTRATNRYREMNADTHQFQVPS